MAKYKLTKDVAGAKSFRHNGVKYVTSDVTQKQLKNLYKIGFIEVIEIKKIVKDESGKENIESD